jgi:K+-transporting ATPase ATPase C chain
MLQHLRASLIYVGLTLFIFCGLYPLVVLGIAKVLFPTQAAGSLIDRSGRSVTDPADAVGSRLIGQPFSDAGYFQPRPSATSPAYNAAASGATNWGASNCQLRDRVARILGPIVKYARGPQKGEPVGPDIDAWFQKDVVGGKETGIVSYWAKHYPTLATNWVKSDPLITEFVAGWMKEHPDEVASWKAEHEENEPQPPDMADAFFESYTKASPGTWLSIKEQANPDGTTQKVVQPVKSGSDIQSYFFDLWIQEHADAELENVPADMVMASGSGLDPHITLKNALYQLDRVAAKWAASAQLPESEVRERIARLLRAEAAAPLGGLAGVPLVNVLEVNIALEKHFGNDSK